VVLGREHDVASQTEVFLVIGAPLFARAPGTSQFFPTGAADENLKM